MSETTNPDPVSDSNLSLRIEKVEKDIEAVHELKESAILTLEEKKRGIKQEADPYGEQLKSIEEEIVAVEKEVEEVLTDVQPKLEEIVERKISVDELGKNIYMMERDISRIQHAHDEAVQQLEAKKKKIRFDLESVENIDILISVLNYKIYEAQHEYRQEMDELQKQKEALLNQTDLSESQMALALAEIDGKIASVDNIHQEAMTSMNYQKKELEQESKFKLESMDEDMEDIRNKRQALLDELEAQKLNATKSELELINAKVEELNEQFDEDFERLSDMQKKGWQDRTSEETLADMLNARSLHVSKSGEMLTRSGRIMTIEEAMRLGLLDGIDMSLEHLLKYRKLSEDEAYEDELQETEEKESFIMSQESSEESVYSKMSSEDVHYLKVVLGKPLTLALAEITAKQPRDPIHYLAHWLLKYRYNQEVDEIKAMEVDALTDERTRLAKEKMHKFIEETARDAVLTMIARAENEAYRNEVERELKRVAEEQAMGEEG